MDRCNKLISKWEKKHFYVSEHLSVLYCSVSLGAVIKAQMPSQSNLFYCLYWTGSLT